MPSSEESRRQQQTIAGTTRVHALLSSRRSEPGSNGYHTDYEVEIQGSLKPDNGHLLILNKTTRIKLQWLQFIVLLILGSHARANAGLTTPIDIRGGDYLQPSRISEIIAQLKDGALLCAGGKLPLCANATDATAIHDAKWDLRKRIKKKQMIPWLIDDGEGAGYRLSCPPGHIKIKLVDPTGNQLFDWVR